MNNRKPVDMCRPLPCAARVIGTSSKDREPRSGSKQLGVAHMEPIKIPRELHMRSPGSAFFRLPTVSALPGCGAHSLRQRLL